MTGTLRLAIVVVAHGVGPLESEVEWRLATSDYSASNNTQLPGAIERYAAAPSVNPSGIV
jgi:hypothetical protein